MFVCVVAGQFLVANEVDLFLQLLMSWVVFFARDMKTRRDHLLSTIYAGVI